MASQTISRHSGIFSYPYFDYIILLLNNKNKYLKKALFKDYFKDFSK
jgi:hypothetical protein